MEGLTLTPLGSALRQLAGAASMCWNPRPGDQVFDSEQANKFCDEAEAQIRMLPADKSTSDGYHTFAELYDYRMAYNALLFNEWAKHGLYGVHRSWKHHDGEDCFAGGKHRWFVVVANLPSGQISNHYKEEFWGLFSWLDERERADEWDGHTPQQALERMFQMLAINMKVDGLMGSGSV